MKFAAFAAAIIVLGLACPVAAQSVPSIEVTGASHVEIDERTGIWQLRGSPVTVRRGAVVLRAPRITYDTKRQIVEASGGMTYADPDAEFAAAAATVWLAEERLVATGGVSGTLKAAEEGTRIRADRVDVSRSPRQMIATGAVTLVRAAMTLTGDRVEYDEARQHAVATGHPAVSGADGTITADRIDAALATEEVTAEGNVRMARGEIEATAPRAVLRNRDRVVILTGGVTVRQGGLQVTAPTMVIDLRTNKITASGGATLIVPPSPTPPTPAPPAP